MITIEFDDKHNIIETYLIHPIDISDKLQIYENVSKANLKIDDGVIIYYEGELILRNILKTTSIDVTKLTKWISYLQIIATAFFKSITETNLPS